MNSFSSRLTGWTIFLIGCPGVGKDTLGEKLKDFFSGHLGSNQTDYIIMSLFLDWRSQSTDATAQKIKNLQEHRKKGGLLPDDLICDILGEYFECSKSGQTILMNGFPRTYEQGKNLRKIVGSQRIRKSVAIFLDLPRSEAKKRLLGRNEGRADDMPETIEKRQNIFEASLPGIVQALQENRIPVLDLSASGSPDEVFSRVSCRLQEFMTESIVDPATTPAARHGQAQSFVPAPSMG